MEDEKWQSFVLYGRTLLVRQDGDRWRLRWDGREVNGVYLDRVLAELISVPAHMGLTLALALLSAPQGSDIS
jgi:hypothetical protein